MENKSWIENYQQQNRKLQQQIDDERDNDKETADLNVFGRTSQI